MIKTKEEIALMRESARILVQGVQETLAAVQEGITTDELNTIFEKKIRELGGEPGFLGYRGYTKSICTSVNDEVVHGIPSNRVLEDGDIIGVDCGVVYKGFHSDMARTVAVGSISEEAQKLIDCTRESLQKAIDVMKPGATIGDIASTVQQYAEERGYAVVKDLVGHGIGNDLHEEPAVPNYGKPKTGLVLEEGMVLAVEPMINIGTDQVEFDRHDGWTVRTKDGTLSAHFENTILITNSGAQVLTNLPL